MRALATILCVLLATAIAQASESKDSALKDTTAQDAELKAYGEYLAGECTTCHRIDGVDNGIPGIIGWDTASFVETLGYYKKGLRKNDAMESVAKTLGDEEMKALAAYFGTLVPKIATQ